MGKTIVLLGAGASKGSKFQLPTMDGFFGDSVDGLPEELKELLQWFYPDKPPSQYNLEEVLSFLFTSHARQQSLPKQDRELGSRIPFGYQNLVNFVELHLQISTEETCDQHVRLFESLDPLDTILTVNYDLIADQSLKLVEKTADEQSVPRTFEGLQKHFRMHKLMNMLGPPRYVGGEPPALVPFERATGFYIKLHGSLDWIWCPNQRCTNSRRFYCVGVERFKAGQETGQPCRLCGASLMAFLVPPVATKTFENEGILASLWNLALRELSEADKVVIIGLSFAPSDQELRWLIRESNAMRQHCVQIVLVNPSRRDREIAKSLFSNVAGAAEFDTLEGYLEAVAEKTT